MLTNVYAHVFLTAAGFDSSQLPPIDDAQKPRRKKAPRRFEVWKKSSPALRETREQYEAPATTSRLK